MECLTRELYYVAVELSWVEIQEEPLEDSVKSHKCQFLSLAHLSSNECFLNIAF